MDKDIEQEIADARAAFDRELQSGLWAKNVWYDNHHNLVLRLANGATLSIPISHIETLHEAEPSQLRNKYLANHGMAVFFPDLDVRLSVRGLVEGRFGTKDWMEQLQYYKAFMEEE